MPAFSHRGYGESMSEVSTHLASVRIGHGTDADQPDGHSRAPCRTRQGRPRAHLIGSPRVRYLASYRSEDQMSGEQYLHWHDGVEFDEETQTWRGYIEDNNFRSNKHL